MRAILPCLAFATLVACSGSTSSVGGGSDAGGSDAATITADQAATDAANAYCNRANACAPMYVTYGYGDVATCAARLKLVLMPVFGSTGTSSTPEQTEACAQAISSVSCADLLSRKNPDVCKTLPGTLADGAACSADSQCQGTRCKVAADAVCGACTSPAAAGAGCGVDGDCQPGMKCVSAVCVQYGDDGSLCDASHPCRPHLGCEAGKCTTPSPAGTPCQSSDECEALKGGYCNPLTKQCDTVTFAQPNASCGLVNNRFVECKGPGALCAGAAAPTYQGTCVGFAADGASCDATNGPLCDVGAVCASGTCQIPDPSKCH